jgi:hypothetical protein
MQRAERDAVGDGRRSAFIAIANDVCGFEELVVLEPADGAMTLVRLEDPLAKLLLMQPLLYDPRRIPLANCGLN